MSNNKYYLGVAFIVAFMAVLVLNPFVIMNSGDRGIVVTLGKVSSKVRGDGLSLRIPLIQKVIPISIRNNVAEGHATAYSSDLQTLTISYKTIYSLPANKLVDLYVQFQGAPYESFVVPRIEEAIKIIAAKYTAEGFVTKREIAKQQIIALVETRLKGIVNIHDIAITNVDLTPELEKAIELKQIEQQKAEQKKYELLGAKQDAQITITRANADAESIRMKANALKLSPQLVELEKVNMMKTKWNGQMPTTMVVDGKGQMILPLK